MRRVANLEGSIEFLFLRANHRASASSLCRTCLARQAAAQLCRSSKASFSTSTPRRAPDEPELSFNERWRRRIWGTDDPRNFDNKTFEPPATPQKTYEPAATPDYPERTPAEEEEAERRAKAAADEEATLEQERRERQRDEDENYEPASTWDGLEVVGTGEEILDPRDAFKGFMPSVRLTSAPHITLALYRAVVETFTLLQHAAPLSDIAGAPPNERVIPRISSVRIRSLVRNVTPVLEFPSDAVREEILASLRPSPALEEQEWIDEEAEQAELDSDAADARPTLVPRQSDAEVEVEVARLGRAWLQIPLHDPSVKFALLKRTAQLTGLLLPDPRLPYLHSVAALLAALHDLVAPRPATTYDALVANEELVGLPNVKVVGRRWTPVDRERAVGRWKGIVRELERRELPVFGHERD